MEITASSIVALETSMKLFLILQHLLASSFRVQRRRFPIRLTLTVH